MLFLSRRSVLAGISTAILARLANFAPVSPAAASVNANGRICLGLNGLTYYSGFSALLNAWKQSAKIRVIANSVDYDSDVPPGGRNSAWNRFLDADGELVSPLPPEVTHMNRIFFAPPGDGAGEGFNRVGEEWVLKWDGGAKDVSISGASSSKRAGNRIIWTWASNTSNMWVTFAGMDRAQPPRNIRICEARHESRLDAGEMFNPEWLAKVREGSGIARFMDWQSTNNNRSTLLFSDIPSARSTSYGGEAKIPFIKGGMPLAVMSTLAKEVGSHPWVCIPDVLGTKKMSMIAAISNGNPAIVSSPGHKWEDGDKVIPFGTDWRQMERNTFTVSNSDQKAGTFALSGLDSTGFGAYNVASATLTSPIDLKSITPQVGPFAAHFRDNVAAPLVTYFELGNELWNWIFSSPHWLAAQARGMFPRDDNNAMAGYLSAHCMNVVRETYGLDNRRRWRGVLATQYINPYVTEQMIVGVNRYIKEHAASLTVADLFDDIAVTGYWGGEDFTKDRKAEIFALMDESEGRGKSGQEPTQYSHFNRIINEKCLAYVKGLMPYWQAQKRIADAQGLGLIQYEGGNHNDPKFSASLSAEELARFMSFYKNSNHTVEDAANYTEMFTSFEKMGGKYPAKFVELGAVSRYGAWGGLRHLGDSNPVWDAVVAFNRPS